MIKTTLYLRLHSCILHNTATHFCVFLSEQLFDRVGTQCCFLWPDRVKLSLCRLYLLQLVSVLTVPLEGTVSGLQECTGADVETGDISTPGKNVNKLEQRVFCRASECYCDSQRLDTGCSAADLHRTGFVTTNEKVRLTVVHGYESSVTFCLNRNSAHVTVLQSTVFPRSPLHLSYRKTSFFIPC